MTATMDKYSKKEFFKILKFYQTANYVQKVAFMNKTWGKIVTTTTITYSDSCKITIGFDSAGKYYFDFSCDAIPFLELEEALPEYADAIMNMDEKEFKEAFPEIQDIRIEFPEEENPLVREGAEEENADTTEATVETNMPSMDYLKIYRGINFK